MELLREAILLVLWLAAPPLLAGLAAGVLAGLLQSATQVQDASLSALPKVAAAGVVLLYSAPAMFAALSRFSARLWGM